MVFFYETEGDPTGLSQQAATRPKGFMRSVKQLFKRKGIKKLMVGMTTGTKKHTVKLANSDNHCFSLFYTDK